MADRLLEILFHLRIGEERPLALPVAVRRVGFHAAEVPPAVGQTEHHANTVTVGQREEMVQYLERLLIELAGPLHVMPGHVPVGGLVLGSRTGRFQIRTTRKFI